MFSVSHRRPVFCFLCIVLIARGVAPAQTIYYVDDDGDPANSCTSWADACPDLQTALSLGGSGDQVWVASGTYKPTAGTDRDEAFSLHSGFALYGGFDGTETTLEERAGLFDRTVLSGDLGAVHAYHVVTAVRVGSPTTLDGFTITGGQATAMPPDLVNDRGGALYISDSTLTIRNCTLIHNTAYNVAGGIWMDESDVTIIDSRIEQNSVWPRGAGGAIHDVFGSNLRLINTVMRNNVLGSGNTGGAAIFVGGNRRGDASSLSATNCVFVGNRASAGGAILNNGFAWLTNTLLVDNQAEGQSHNDFTGKGGAIVNFGELTVTNCSFSNNEAVRAGAGLFNGFRTSNTNLDSITVVANTVLWGNSAPLDPESAQIDSADEDVLVDYSCVEGLSGNLGGLGNIGEDPLFVDSAAGNLRLSAGSPCIDAGDNFAVPEDVSIDLDGLPRFQNVPGTRDTGRPGGVRLTVDMGAYEFGACTDDDGDGLVTICHFPRGNPGNSRTITVSENAVPAHLAHGDICGECQHDKATRFYADRARASLRAFEHRAGFDQDANPVGRQLRLGRDSILGANRAIDVDADGDVEEDAQ